VPGSQDKKVPICDFCFEEIRLLQSKKQHTINENNSVWKSDFLVNTAEKKEAEKAKRREKIFQYKITHLD
jgi:hypothetical protein